MFKASLTCLLVLACASAGAQNGLNLKTEGAHEADSRLRLGLGKLQLDLSVAQPGTAQSRTRLLGDYYLTGPGFGHEQLTGGLRVTSGLAMGPRDSTRALPASRFDSSLQVGVREAGFSLGERNNGRVALPYVGLGYTTWSAREGWGLSADIGLGGVRPGERVRLGAGGPTAAQVENVLNDLRLSPVIQLGVSYSF